MSINENKDHGFHENMKSIAMKGKIENGIFKYFVCILMFADDKTSLKNENMVIKTINIR